MNLASLPVKQGHFQGKSKEAQTCLYGWDEIAVNSEENGKHMPGWAQSMPPGGRGRGQDTVTWKRWSLSLIHSAPLGTCHVPGQEQNVKMQC